MNNIEFALVVLLSVGFLILIVLSIIVVSLMLTIMRNLKRISQRAESATENVAGIAETITRSLAPLAASGLMGMMVKKFTGKRKSKGN